MISQVSGGDFLLVKAVYFLPKQENYGLSLRDLIMKNGGRSESTKTSQSHK